jgi:hypothetical protein
MVGLWHDDGRTLFHSVLGARQGVLDAAERLRQDGHDVLVVDLYDSRTFDDYPPAMDFAWKEVGQKVLLERAVEAVADLPDGFMPAGFWLGCVLAVHVATQLGLGRPHHRRRRTGVGLRRRRSVAGGCFGADTLHPFRPPGASRRSSTRRCTTSSGTIEVFDYPAPATCSLTRRCPTSTTRSSLKPSEAAPCRSSGPVA